MTDRKKRRASEIEAVWPNWYTVSCGGPNENTSCHLRFCHTTTHTCFPSHSTGQSNVPCWELSLMATCSCYWAIWSALTAVCSGGFCGADMRCSSLQCCFGLCSVDFSECRVSRMTVRAFSHSVDQSLFDVVFGSLGFSFGWILKVL